MTSYSHWGMFDGSTTPIGAPLSWIVDLCQIEAALISYDSKYLHG